jgi:NADPH:quinone reductase-like Zn-dependent oxidoreductase
VARPSPRRAERRLAAREIEEPGPGEIQIRVSAATLNFSDLDGIQRRYGSVPTPMPYTPGMEVLGEVAACGPGAESWRGRRVVAIPSGAFGGYAEVAVAPVALTLGGEDRALSRARRRARDRLPHDRLRRGGARGDCRPRGRRRLDTVGGEVTAKAFRCMAFSGRYVLAGFASGIAQGDGAARDDRQDRRPGLSAPGFDARSS